jgi:hypothetical protein
MTKEAPNPNDEIVGRLWQTPWRFAETPGQTRTSLVRHLSIRHSFEFRHSDFVILPLVSDFVILPLVSNFDIRYSNF